MSSWKIQFSAKLTNKRQHSVLDLSVTGSQSAFHKQEVVETKLLVQEFVDRGEENTWWTNWLTIFEYKKLNINWMHGQCPNPTEPEKQEVCLFWKRCVNDDSWCLFWTVLCEWNSYN